MSLPPTQQAQGKFEIQEALHQINLTTKQMEVSRKMESSVVNGARPVAELSISHDLAGALPFVPHLNLLPFVVSFNSVTFFVHIVEMAAPRNLWSLSSYINS